MIIFLDVVNTIVKSKTNLKTINVKKSILALFIVAFVLVSCKQNNKKDETMNSETMNSENTTQDINNSKFSIEEIVSNYLSIKNALTKDDSNSAAEAGKTFVETLSKLDMKNLSDDKMKSYMDIADDAKENAEHIGDNSGKIDHQREHFVLLSKDVNDLITTFGTQQKLYQDYCPMADDNKGAIWISETKDIKNPYLGAKMPTCGTVKKEL
ncbi:DUF3347 domain-containing protein [Flavobacterium cellulosilyticum]|uniref:DUF3347 domain-containing protein n=1 Tax=Flavobacterium cellulosilyticum TaxID=2541731 RepID=A0A4R5CDR4_9FLAO|nr:DUF3347 domain-containing protein [Flavobacterium cellulosilyticum]TDD97079.1 DUF3347 domain-containing protein [Flavobacterium cellulosilyticum]